MCDGRERGEEALTMSRNPCRFALKLSLFIDGTVRCSFNRYNIFFWLAHGRQSLAGKLASCNAQFARTCEQR